MSRSATRIQFRKSFTEWNQYWQWVYDEYYIPLVIEEGWGMERFFVAFGFERPHVVETETRIDGVTTTITRNFAEPTYYTRDYPAQLAKERTLNTAMPFVVDADLWLSDCEDEMHYYNATRYYNLSEVTSPH